MAPLLQKGTYSYRNFLRVEWQGFGQAPAQGQRTPSWSLIAVAPDAVLYQRGAKAAAKLGYKNVKHLSAGFRVGKNPVPKWPRSKFL